jgi:CMP-N-acetylneuraminic acid synthetase
VVALKTLAIIPARGGSKRLPGKNVRSFLGVPLIYWSIRFAQNMDRFDKIAVSTDSDEIASASREAGIEVPYLRPAPLATDTASSADVLLDVLARERENGRSYDLVALLQPTSPMRETSRWHEAFARIEQGDCDAVIGVAPVRNHPFHVFHWKDGTVLKPFSNPQGLRLRSQELPQAVYVTGNMYLIRCAVLEQYKSFFPPRTCGILCDQPYEAVDIDTEADWVAAEALATYYDRSP